jgi:hypothetical protein
MELMEVVDRLSVEFAGDLPQDMVEVVVRRTAAQWDGAPVQGYIPLLTENAARKYLRHVVAAHSSSAVVERSEEVSVPTP